MFPRLDPALYNIADDEQLVLDLLREEKILLVQGTAFNWPHPDHVRVVFLPHREILTDAIVRFGEIGRASCRERVWMTDGVGRLIRKRANGESRMGRGNG